MGRKGITKRQLAKILLLDNDGRLPTQIAQSFIENIHLGEIEETIEVDTRPFAGKNPLKIFTENFTSEEMKNICKHVGGKFVWQSLNYSCNFSDGGVVQLRLKKFPTPLGRFSHAEKYCEEVGIEPANLAELMAALLQHPEFFSRDITKYLVKDVSYCRKIVALGSRGKTSNNQEVGVPVLCGSANNPGFCYKPYEGMLIKDEMYDLLVRV